MLMKQYNNLTGGNLNPTYVFLHEKKGNRKFSFLSSDSYFHIPNCLNLSIINTWDHRVSDNFYFPFNIMASRTERR